MNAQPIQFHPHRGKPRLSKEQKAEIIELCRDPGSNYDEIAKAYGTSNSTISYIARRAGIRRQYRGNSNMEGQTVARRKETAAELDARLAQMQEEMDRLRLRRKAMEIGFEWVDDTTILVRGVDTQFIELEGVAKFRQFITDTINKRK